jgi:hypothetical protein
VPTTSRTILTSDASPPAGPPAEFLPRSTPGAGWKTLGLLACVLNVPLAFWAISVGASAALALVSGPYPTANVFAMWPVILVAASLSLYLCLPLSVVAAIGARRYGHRSTVLAVLITLSLSILNVANAVVFFVKFWVFP